jgi:hypothetical protein
MTAKCGESGSTPVTLVTYWLRKTLSTSITYTTVTSVTSVISMGTNIRGKNMKEEKHIAFYMLIPSMRFSHIGRYTPILLSGCTGYKC